MKKIVLKYRISKFRRFTSGLLFASISLAALILCISDLTNADASKLEILFPFLIAIISLFMGFMAMFRNSGLAGRKI